MEEIYKTVQGFENYEVSNFGAVRNKTTQRRLKGNNHMGYLRIGLSKDEKTKLLFIHRLVALAFVDNPDKKTEIDHINNNKIDNNALNLRWCNRQENNRNTQVSKTNLNGVKGISFYGKQKKYRARICIDGVSVWLGSFKTLEEAKQARINKVNEVFGEFIHSSGKQNEIFV